MKRGLLGAFVLLFVATALSLIPPTAHAVPLFVKINGAVTKNGRPVPGIQVGVNCRSEFLYKPVGNTNTDSSGNYVVYAATFDCPAGAAIEVTAGPDSEGKSVTVIKSRIFPETLINVEIGSIIPIPEYGWLSGTLAVVTGVGAFTIVRRRQYN